MSEQAIYGANAISDPAQTIVGIPGSTKLGTPQYSIDPTILQNSAFAGGSIQMLATIGSQIKNPVQETENTPAFLMSSNIQAMQRAGILLPWDSSVTYSQHSIVLAANTTLVYVSLQNLNLGYALTNIAYWKLYGDLSGLEPATTSSAGVVTMASGSLNNVVAPIDSPNLTGIPLAPTASPVTNTTQLATTAFITRQQVHFSVWNTATQTIPGNVYTKLTFDSKDTDNTNSFTNSRFTAPLAGVYLLGAQYIALPGTSPTTASINIYKNGSAYFGSSTYAQQTTVQLVSVQYIVFLNIGEYVETFAASSFTGGPLNITNGRGILFFGSLLQAV